MLISTKRLNIKQYTKHNEQDFNDILMNDNIMKGIRGKGHTAEITKQKFEEALLENEKYDDLGFFNVTTNDTHELVGFAKLVTIDEHNLELGYALIENLWGLGYASEITNALVNHSLKTYPKKGIMGIVNDVNEASSNVLLKQNFELKSNTVIDGFNVGYYYFSK
jgi:RimJ/RimL family protein N-acetyltransferase